LHHDAPYTNYNSGVPIMSENVFPRDRTLTVLSMVIGVLIWMSVAAVISLGGARALIGVASTALIVVLPRIFVCPKRWT
jgi:hypothetical protein